MCIEWGLKKSRARLLLFSFFAQSHQPAAIPEILGWCETHDALPNKTTLYREIESLVKQGIVRAVQLAPRKTSYELAHHEHHHHFVCTNCEDVTDVRLPEGSIEKTERLLGEAGAIVTHHTLEFFGLCQSCNKI